MLKSKVLWVLDEELDGRTFERLCTDLLYRQGFKDIVPIEPQDGGRDAEELPRRGRGRESEATFFQFSLERDWKAKLRRDGRTLKCRGFDFSTLVFVTNRRARGVDINSLKAEFHKMYGWELVVFSREWLRFQLEEVCPDLAAKYLGVDIPVGLSHLSAEARPDGPSDARLSEIWAATSAGNFERAVLESRRFVDEQPESAQGWQTLAWAQYCMHSYSEALVSISRARKIEDSSRARSIWACILAEKGIRDGNRAAVLEAKRLFERLLKQGQANDWRPLYNLANTLSALGEHLEAITLYRRALDVEARNPTIWKNLGSAYHQIGDHSSEMECFDKALEINPLLPEALVSKGVSQLVDFGKPEEAVALLERALTSTAEWVAHWPPIWYWLGEAHRRRGSSNQALSYVEDGLAHVPGNLALSRLKSELLADLATPKSDLSEKAREFWRSQLSAEPRDYGSRSRLARLEVQEGNSVAAWELIEECFDLIGIHPVVQLRTSGFPLDFCITALRFLPHYAAFRKRAPVSVYWDRMDPVYDLPFAPPVSDHIEGAMTTFLAVPFGLGLEFLERGPAPRARKETLIRFFDALRPHVEHALIESGRELAALVPPKELGVDATVSRLTEVIMFLALVALREFARQRGWIAAQFRITTETMNEAISCYDEQLVHSNVLTGSLARINKEVHLVPE